MTDKDKSKILQEVRTEIDHLDIEIVKQLKRRTEKVLISRRLKTATEDLGREKAVLATVTRSADSLVREEFLTGLFTKIMQESKLQQERNPVLAAFCGEHGAFGENAIRVWNPDWAALPQKDIDLVIKRTKAGIFDYAVIALESTQAGVDRLANSLLADCGLFVIGAVDMQINHCLLTLPETSYQDIRTVYSHPQAISQCREFIRRHNLEVVNMHDTGSAASLLSEKRFPGTAVIASAEAAAIYNLALIKDNIQDNRINRTRFLILGRKMVTEIPGKCSLIFSTSATLAQLFRELTDTGLDLVRIESHGNQEGSLTVFADFKVENSAEYDRLQSWFDNGILQKIRLLGCYREIQV